MPSVFLSSTSELAEHRKKLANWISQKGDGWSAVFQDGGLVKPEAPLETSLRMIERSDVVIVLLGRLYGTKPKGEQKSFCELEYEATLRLKKPCLAFVIDERQHHCPPEHLDIVADDQEQLSRQKLFRQRVRADLNVGDEPFKSVDNLVAIAVQAIEALFSAYRAPYGKAEGQGPDKSRFVVPKPPTLFAPYPYSLQSGRFVGRIGELRALSAWVDETDDPVFVLTALGGAGKSALAWKWVHEHVRTLQTTFEGVFWWSFYDDSSFERCVALLLAYATQDDSGKFLDRSFDHNLRDLLSHLHARRFLICLDGIERVLRGYRELDIAQGAADLFTIESPMNLENFDAAYIGDNSLLMNRSEYRQGVGKVGNFLFQLPTLITSRVLCSTRLFPADFELNGVVRNGVAMFENLDFSDKDALELLEALHIRGERKTLLSLSNAVGNHPLTMRIFSGEVAKNPIANGNIDVWLSRHPDFDPYKLEIRQRRRHVLVFALRGLRARSLAVLGAIAAFRGPAPVADLEKILVSDGGFLSSGGDLEDAIADLRDRHLVGWGSQRSEFDMHPIVRGVSWKSFDRKSQERLATLHGEHFETLAAVANMSASARFYTLQQRFFSFIERRRHLEAFSLIDDRVNDEAVKHGKNQECVDMLEACLDGGKLDRPLIDGIDQQIQFFSQLSFHYSYCDRPREMLDVDLQLLVLKNRHSEQQTERFRLGELYNVIVTLWQNGYFSEMRKLANLNRNAWMNNQIMRGLYGYFHVFDGEYDTGLEILFKHALNGLEGEPASWSIDRFRACETIVDCCLNQRTKQHDINFAKKIAILALRIARAHPLDHQILIGETMIDQIDAFLSILPERAIVRIAARLERVRQRNLVQVEIGILTRLLATYAHIRDFERGELIAQDCITLVKFANQRGLKLKLSIAVARYYDAAGDSASAHTWAKNAQTFASQPDGSPGVTCDWREAVSIKARHEGALGEVGFHSDVQAEFPERDIGTLMSLVLSMTGDQGKKVTN